MTTEKIERVSGNPGYRGVSGTISRSNPDSRKGNVRVVVEHVDTYRSGEGGSITWTYEDGTSETLTMIGNGTMNFKKPNGEFNLTYGDDPTDMYPSHAQYVNIGGPGDYSDALMHITGLQKQYKFEKVEGLKSWGGKPGGNSWIFETLDNGVTSIEMSNEETMWGGFDGIELTWLPYKVRPPSPKIVAENAAREEAKKRNAPDDVAEEARVAAGLAMARGEGETQAALAAKAVVDQWEEEKALEEAAAAKTRAENAAKQEAKRRNAPDDVVEEARVAAGNAMTQGKNEIQAVEEGKAVVDQWEAEKAADEEAAAAAAAKTRAENEAVRVARASGVPEDVVEEARTAAGNAMTQGANETEAVEEGKAVVDQFFVMNPVWVADAVKSNTATPEIFDVENTSKTYEQYPDHPFLIVHVKNIDISQLGNGGSITWHYEDGVAVTLDMRRDRGALVLLSEYGEETSLSHTWSKDNRDRFEGNAYLQRKLVLPKHMGFERQQDKDWQNEWKFTTGPVKYVTFHHEWGKQDWSAGFHQVQLTWYESDPDPDASAKFVPLVIHDPEIPPAGGFLPAGIHQRFNASTYKNTTTWEDKYFENSQRHAQNIQAGSSSMHMPTGDQKFAYVEGDANSKWDLTGGFSRDNWTFAFVTRYSENGPFETILQAHTHPDNTAIGHQSNTAGTYTEGGIGVGERGIPGDKKQWIYGIVQNRILWVRGSDPKWYRKYGGRVITPRWVSINNHPHLHSSGWNLADFISWREKLPEGKINDIKRFLDDYAQGKIDVFEAEPQPRPPAVPRPPTEPPIEEEPFDVRINQEGNVKKYNPHFQAGGGYADILIDNMGVNSGEIVFTYEDMTVHTLGPFNTQGHKVCFGGCKDKKQLHIGNYGNLGNFSNLPGGYTFWLYFNRPPYKCRIINYDISQTSEHNTTNYNMLSKLRSVEFKPKTDTGFFMGVHINWYNISSIPPKDNLIFMREKENMKSAGITEQLSVSTTHNDYISNLVNTLIPQEQVQLLSVSNILSLARVETSTLSLTKESKRLREEQILGRIETKSAAYQRLSVSGVIDAHVSMASTLSVARQEYNDLSVQMLSLQGELRERRKVKDNLISRFS